MAWGDYISAPPARSKEFDRVRSLPRRQWTWPELRELSEVWSPQLLTARGLRLWRRAETSTDRETTLRDLACAGTPIRLKPEQALMLREYEACAGLFGGAPVGAGKTLTAWLIALLTCEAADAPVRSVLVLQANGVAQARQNFAKFREVWRAPDPEPEIVTYSALGLPANVGMLCTCSRCLSEPPEGSRNLRPTLVICDESDMLRNQHSSVSKRVGRYIAKHLDQVICAFLTGTPQRHSLAPFARQIIWALRENSPVPIQRDELASWAAAVDPKLLGDPGALLMLEPGYEHTPRDQRHEAARGIVRRRLAETSGVVLIEESSCDTPLTIRTIPFECPTLDAAFLVLRETDQTPDGWQLGDALSVLREATALGLGFYDCWDPRPPAEWLAARTAWKQFVRRATTNSQGGRRPLDSEGAVARAYPQAPERLAWLAVRDAFAAKTKPVAVTHSVVLRAADWLRSNSPALVWVSRDWFGRQLARLTGYPYYGAEGRTDAGEWIGVRDTPEKARVSAVLSTHANRRSRNLQGYSRCLVVGPEHSAERWEQMLGRMHRYGQERPVECDVLLTCGDNIDALNAALLEARGLVTGMRQKVLDATWDWSRVPEVVSGDDARLARWRRKVAE